MTERKTNSAWGAGPLESSLPHIIVDAAGVRQRPLNGFPPFPNRTQATRVLNILRKRKGSAFITGNPHDWRVIPFCEPQSMDSHTSGGK